MKYCKAKSDVPPSTRHWAVVRFTTVHIPGDERSRTNSGHGYSAEDKPVAEYIVFDNAQEMQRWVEQNHSDNNFVVLIAENKAVTAKMVVEVG